MHRPRLEQQWIRAALTIAVTIAVPTTASRALDFALTPARIDVSPGEVFTVELRADASADSFNGYDMALAYDPKTLVLLGATAVQQEGPLFTQACPQRYHLFTIDPDSSIAHVAHVLLCAGVKVAGPGVLYRLNFRAPTENALTHLRLVEGTAAYDAGTFVIPFTTRDAVVAVGDVTATAPLLSRGHLLAHPNPFNPVTTLSWEAPRAGWTRLELYSLAGRFVATLWSGFGTAGARHYDWQADPQLASGVYFVHLSSPDLQMTTRVVLLK